MAGGKRRLHREETLDFHVIPACFWRESSVFAFSNKIPAMTGEKQPAVYILASKRNGTLYIGVTGHLAQRIWQHRNDVTEGFSKKYQIHMLVYFELHGSMESAILREKQLKKWERRWKIHLIEKANPYWRDLYSEIVGGA
jgi:putative endonuclease